MTIANNFSHFLLDFWSFFAHLSLSGFQYRSLPLDIPIFQPLPDWQKSYFDLISPFTPSSFNHIFSHAKSSGLWFCPSSIYFPIFNNKPLALLSARNYLHQIYSQHLISPDIDPLEGRIIFLTRNDSRRSRISNITEIEDLVTTMGGHVINPIQYSIFERIKLFSSPSVFIAESSGCMNFALFANEKSRQISLLDPSSLHSNQLLAGGYIYSIGYAHNTDYVIGTDPEILPGSAVGSSIFSIHKILEILNSRRRLLT